MSDIVEFNKDLYIFHVNKETKNDVETDIFYIKSKDEGVTWSSKHFVSENASDAKYICADSFHSNIIHVLYAENVEASPQQYYLSYAKGYLDAGDIVWNSQRFTYDTAYPKKFIDTAMTVDKCHFVFEENNKVYYSYLDNTDEEADAIVENDRLLIAENATCPRIIIDSSNNIFIFFITGGDIKYVRYNAAFNSWSQKFLVTEDVDVIVDNLTLAIDYLDINNSIHLLYVKDNAVKHIRSISNKKWTTPINIFSDTTYEYCPEIVIDCDGNVNALAGARSLSSPSTGDKLFYRYSTDSVVWNSIEEISRYTPYQSTTIAQDIKPAAITDYKSALNVTYIEKHIEYNETQADQIYFKIVDGVFDPFENPVIPLISISPTFLAKNKQRNFSQANLVQDVNDKFFLYEYDSLFREVTVKTSEDYGNTWTRESTAWAAADTIKDLTIRCNGYDTVALYKKYNTGSWSIYYRTLYQGDTEWTDEAMLVATTVSMKEKSIDFQLTSDNIYVIWVEWNGSNWVIRVFDGLQFLLRTFNVLGTPATNSNTGDTVDVNVALEIYTTSDSPELVKALVVHTETYYIDIGDETLGMRKRLVATSIDILNDVQVRTVIDDDWVESDYNNFNNLTGVSVSIDKTNKQVAHICYNKTIWPTELYVGRDKYEQVTYWSAYVLQDDSYYQPTEVIKSSKPINLEQVYFNETRCVAIPGSNDIYIISSGKHVSTLGTNYATWFVRAEMNILDNIRTLTKKKLVSFTTFIDDFNNECITLMVDSQDSLHFVTNQYSEVSYGNSVYSKLINDDQPVIEYQTVLPALIEPLESEPPV